MSRLLPVTHLSIIEDDQFLKKCKNSHRYCDRYCLVLFSSSYGHYQMAFSSSPGSVRHSERGGKQAVSGDVFINLADI